MQKVWAILQVIERLICDLTNEYIIDIEKDNVELLSLFKNGGKYRLQESADLHTVILVWEEGDVKIQRLILIRKNENFFYSDGTLIQCKLEGIIMIESYSKTSNIKTCQVSLEIDIIRYTIYIESFNAVDPEEQDYRRINDEGKDEVDLEEQDYRRIIDEGKDEVDLEEQDYRRINDEGEIAVYPEEKIDRPSTMYVEVENYYKTDQENSDRTNFEGENTMGQQEHGKTRINKRSNKYVIIVCSIMHIICGVCVVTFLLVFLKLCLLEKMRKEVN